MSFSFPLPLLLDGATGTELQKRGMPLNVCSEPWILEHPEAILELQRAYVQAGSQVIYVPTFNCTRPNLDRHKVSRDVASLCRELVALSRQAAGEGALVAGDMSPTGLQMEPFGESSFADIVEIYREQAQALEDAGVDLFAVESFVSVEEAKAALTAVKQVSGKPVFVSIPCGPTGRSVWGDDLAEAAPELEALGADAYGINCCGDLELLLRLVGEIRVRCSLPILVKPNAGAPVMENGAAVYKMTPQELAAHIPGLSAAGASIFGGCCGTGPAHIAAIRDALSKL